MANETNSNLQSVKWRSAMEQAIASKESDDIVISYQEVAMAFPSLEPNPRSFDHPLIDHSQLSNWAA